MGEDELRLSEAHRKMLLEESAIPESIVRERGYRTVTTQAELGRLGFSGGQRNAPGLLIPIWGVAGEIVTYQFRPDNPRSAGKGKVTKYETPARSRMALDVPRCIRNLLGSAAIPLFITEGAKKADAAAAKGLCCIALLGVWNFRGKNVEAGSTVLSDWGHVNLKGRKVYVCFDSDVMVKPSVHRALVRLARWLGEVRQAEVACIYLPSGDGAKVGLDDYFAAGETPEELVRLARPVPTEVEEEEDEPEYRFHEHRIERFVHWRDGERARWVKLSNFEAKIVRETRRDDGGGEPPELTFDISGVRFDGVPFPTMKIAARQFGAMNWVMDWGARAIIESGFGAKEHLRAAIQTLSDPEEATFYTHTGWRRVGEVDVFLHAGGGICSSGESSRFLVELSEQLDRYRLPDPPADEELREAIRASVRFLDVAPDRISIPVFALLWRSVMGSCEFTLWVEGKTGQLKTSLVLAALGHFGPGWLERRALMRWDSTRAALEAASFYAKDVPLLIDDYKPGSSSVDETVNTFLQALGDSSNKQRSNTSLELRASRPPRCTVIGTGEQSPPGTESTIGRCLVVHLRAGDVSLSELGVFQQLAREGAPAKAMAGFVRLVAGGLAQVRREMSDRVGEIRDELRGSAVKGAHARSYENCANLLVGMHLFCWFAVKVGAVSSSEAEALVRRSRKALLECLAEQRDIAAESDPLTRLYSLTGQALTAELAHVLDAKTGRYPGEGFGWRVEQRTAMGVEEDTPPRPMGTMIGWIDSEAGHFLLVPDAWFGVVQRMAHMSGESFTWSKAGLLRQAKEAGHLARCEKNRCDSKESVIGSGGDRMRPRVLVLWVSHVAETGASGADGSDEVSQVQEEVALPQRSAPEWVEIEPDFGSEIGAKDVFEEPEEVASVPDSPSAPDSDGSNGPGKVIL